MDCNLSDEQRAEGSRCRGWDCNPCANFSRDNTHTPTPKRHDGAGYGISKDRVHDVYDSFSIKEKEYMEGQLRNAECLYGLSGFSETNDFREAFRIGYLVSRIDNLVI